MQALALPFDGALGLEVFQHAFKGDPRGAVDIENASDFPFADFAPRFAAKGFALAGDEGQNVRAGGQSFIAPLVRRFGDVLSGISRTGGFFHARLAFFDFCAGGLPAAFLGAAAALVFGAARLVFLARDLVPAPCLSSIKRIASSSVIVSGDMPPFKVALVLPRLT
jgi:hypothetical protein